MLLNLSDLLKGGPGGRCGRAVVLSGVSEPMSMEPTLIPYLMAETQSHAMGSPAAKSEIHLIHAVHG